MDNFKLYFNDYAFQYCDCKQLFKWFQNYVVDITVIYVFNLNILMIHSSVVNINIYVFNEVLKPHRK